MAQPATGQRQRFGRRDWRKALASRKGAALAGILCALVAAVIVVMAMAGYRKTVNTGATTQTVFVATQMIARNTPASVIAAQDLFKPIEVRTGQAAAGALTDMSLLHGTVAAQAIYPGQQLTSADFTTSGGLSSQLSATERALNVNLDGEHGLIGTLEVGDHVDVYAGVQEAGSGASGSVPVLTLLMSDIPVLNVPTQAGGSVGTTPTSGGNVTLGVNSDQAGVLAYAADNGKVWLVLRPANGASTTPPTTITEQSLLAAAGLTAAPGGK